jgi:hypothetical protein
MDFASELSLAVFADVLVLTRALALPFPLQQAFFKFLLKSCGWQLTALALVFSTDCYHTDILISGSWLFVPHWMKVGTQRDLLDGIICQ